MSSNRTNFSINKINDDHIIRIFENSAKRHLNWNMTNTHISQATSTASPKDVVATMYFVCDHQGLPKKVKVVEGTGNQKAKMVQTKLIKDGCKAKIIKKTLQNGNVVVGYLWQHATHQPEKVQNIVYSRLPVELKQWILSHVDNNMHWKAIKMLLCIDHQRLEELEAGLGISSFLMSLRINYHDVQNVINARLNKLSRKNVIDKASVEQWIEFLEKEKNYLVHIVFHQDLQILGGFQQALISVYDCCENLRVKRVIINCNPVEIDALKEVFGQSIQILLCHKHIKRAWEMHIKKDHKQNAVRVALNLMMHAKIKEAFDQQYKKFVSKFAGYGKFDARFYTNNLIESYQHILKAYYLGRSRNFQVDQLFKKFVLIHVEKAKKKGAFDIDHEDALHMIETVEDNLYELLVKEEVLIMGLQYSLIKELHIVQNPEVQVVERSEESTEAQNELHLLKFNEVSESLFKFFEQAFRKTESRKLEEWFWDGRNTPDFERLLVSDRRNWSCSSAKV
ncbi:hypothetical protein PHYBLDRAFT_151878 [Phycomyces blakesleeanus NRRL 1555(-)]|uniref:MULE transposase domain-containing protein n=1 Tax=Phycomyces blakesleeanus (strain ATCC 8743b / DSM 1359 / FGSC 10004 / NBRC 33097 / NRRL 1555) TaxID=763407 RepID=A0A162ZI69_PHYB8|nr:hypothetical protein PHYBLDRAFT_151878 [Phycomyces blakesleeanus NRRL 1555(-)]OAD66941.1 hypothetical protein PHYBLDRAFT_151878 [Phycomyces blakesleeanus NRRL 1555(-)]|eukprot:XP_018284981.1 hypothetical protein PHYBLDRAFT_151878 [Phycomyces blakesleeanus NRRL 1555(-)]